MATSSNPLLVVGVIAAVVFVLSVAFVREREGGLVAISETKRMYLAAGNMAFVFGLLLMYNTAKVQNTTLASMAAAPPQGHSPQPFPYARPY